MTELKHLENDCCAECGSRSMTLAQDMTEYSPCEFVNGKWQTTYAHHEYIDGEEVVRFFCADCGTRHWVPNELGG